MVIRRLNKEEHNRTRDLYETVFSEDEKSFVDYYYQYKAAENVIYGAEDEAGIHAMAHLNPCQVIWNEKTEEISYLVAVATEETYRHQGLMRRLLELALREERERKAPFVFLMPASEAIYTPFGFRRAWEWRWEEDAAEDRRQTAKLRAAEGGRGWIPVSECREEELEELSRQVNETLSRRFSLFVRRTPAYYRRLKKEQEACGGRVEVLFENGTPLYARCTAREQFPPMMVRIADLEAFLKQVRTKRERICIWRIHDSVLPENDGWFEVTLTARGGKLRRLPGDGDEGGLNPRESGSQERRELDISRVPEALGEDNPFLRAMICEVV